MTEITVTLDWRQIDTTAIMGHLNARFDGRWTWVGIGLVSLLAAVLTLELIAMVSPTAGSGIDGGLAVLIGVLAFVLLTQLRQRRLMRAVFAAPARREPTKIILDTKGIDAPGALAVGRIPWHWITEVVAWDDALLLLFSPVEYNPLADNGLPDGMTRTELEDQIAAGREAK